MIVVTIVILDFAQYLEHLLVHRIPWLWRCHRMHHADLDYDVTTGFRFHPLEGLFMVAWRMSVVGLLGLPVVAVLLAELLLVSSNYFVHGNVRLSLTLDRVLRWVVVTPDLHRVHHSAEMREANSNFGSLINIWDRLFHTYTDQPEAGHVGMTVGLNDFRDPKYMLIPWMLVHPFLNAPGSDRVEAPTPAINRNA